jgi:hypothetical protein
MADTYTKIAHRIFCLVDWDALAKACAPQVGVPVSNSPQGVGRYTGVSTQFKHGDPVIVGLNASHFRGYRGTIDSFVPPGDYRVKLDLGSASHSHAYAIFEYWELHPAPVTSSLQQAMDASALSRASAASGTIAASKKTEQLSLPNGWYVDQNAWVDDKQRATWKAEGKCETCGDLLPMSIHGLGECPKHPKQLPPDFKQ